MMEKTYQFQNFEQEILAWWAIHLPKKKPTKGPYTVMMPPPNITGSLHLGHALSSTFQDILIRYHRMQGYNVLWLPGTDHAGIATQMMVERNLQEKGQNRIDLGREKFLKAVLEWKDEYGTRIIEQMKRLGFSANWDRLCFTLDEPRCKAVTQAFITLYKKGLIYRAQRLVNWDPQLKTALSDLEVISKNEKGTLWTLRYETVDGKEYIDVATSRPETLFGDQAVAVHPKDARYQHLIGKKVRVPLTDHIIPILADDAVTPEKGTGAVKITPGHDPLDYAIAQRHGLELVTILHEDATLNGHVPKDFQGLSILKARQKVLDDLGPKVIEAVAISHDRPYSERSGASIEPRLTWQWYLDVAQMAQKSMQAVDQGLTVFKPEEWKDQFQYWMKNIQPWCLSRQLWWGHRLPVWYGPEGGVFVATSSEKAQEQARQHYGKPVDLTQDEDVLDTWFSSGLWPFSTLGWPEPTADMIERYPTDVLVTGFDILFFWVARMMMLSLDLTGKVPFKQVFIHPLIRDDKGQKMSKTKKNVVDPLDLVEKYGADALRFALISRPSGKQHMCFSTHHVETAQHFMTKIWNIGRFLVHHNVFAHTSSKRTSLNWSVNQSIAWSLSQTISTIEKDLAEHRFFDAAKTLYDFVWHEYCDVYLELAKEALLEDTLCAEVRDTLQWTFETILRIAHPFVPFITEKMWHVLKGEWGLSLKEWPLLKAPETQGVHDLKWFKELTHLLNRIKNSFFTEKESKMSIALYDLTVSQKTLIHQVMPFLVKKIGCACVLVEEKLEKNSVLFLVGKTKIFVSLPQESLEKHRQEIQTTLQKHQKDILSLEAKLKDENFMTRADPYVIQDHQRRLVEEKALAQELSSWITIFG